MKTTVVSAEQILSAPGRPLSARYWVDRRQGETYVQWRARRAAIASARRTLRALEFSRESLIELLRGLEQ